MMCDMRYRLRRSRTEEDAAMPRTPSNRYPWGTETPGPRLRSTSAKARAGLEHVDEPGFHRIAERVDAAVQAIRPLVDTMEYVARAGLRVRGAGDDTVRGKDVSDAVREVRRALVALHASTALTQSACCEALVAAVTKLMGLADTGTEHGIAGTGESDPDDPWQAFGA